MENLSNEELLDLFYASMALLRLYPEPGENRNHYLKKANEYRTEILKRMSKR